MWTQRYTKLIKDADKHDESELKFYYLESGKKAFHLFPSAYEVM